MFAVFFAEHISFSTANHFIHLTCATFPHKKAAQAFLCACTKTACIVKCALHHHLCNLLLMCQNGHFSIFCNEEIDRNDKNLKYDCPNSIIIYTPIAATVPLLLIMHPWL